MGYAWHIKWLKEGVEAWNARRLRREFRPSLSNADFTNADLPGVMLSDANLAGANLAGANLASADLTYVDLTDANLTGANLTGANLAGANLPGANLVGANLVGANLFGANLVGANLAGTDLTRVNLDGADLTRATLTDATLTDAIFTDAIFDDHARSTIQDSVRVAANITKPIDSIAVLISEINTIETYMLTLGQPMRLYFRGEPRIYDSLEPSVLRKVDLVEHESKMLDDLILQHPVEVGGRLPALVQWSIARHHGLRTRFLDITRDSLVALFFACEECEAYKECETCKERETCEKCKACKECKGIRASQQPDDLNRIDPDGRVHVFAVPEALIKQHDSDTVRVISNFFKLSYGDQEAIRCETGEELDARNHLIQLVQKEKGNDVFDENIDKDDLVHVFIVEPEYSFPRIKVQKSAYIVSANPNGISGATYQRYTLTVPSDCKDRLRTELIAQGFTCEKLFPDLQSSAREINEKYVDMARSGEGHAE